MSEKLRKIARQYRIDPDKLPAVDSNSVTIRLGPNVPATPAESPINYPTSKEARRSEYDRLKAEFQEAKRRLEEYVRADKQRRQTERLQSVIR